MVERALAVSGRVESQQPGSHIVAQKEGLGRVWAKPCVCEKAEQLASVFPDESDMSSEKAFGIC